VHPSYACHRNGVADAHLSVLEHTMRCFAEPSLTELLSEPIVRQLMARDGTSERQVRAIATLARRRIELQRRQSLVSNEPPPAWSGNKNCSQTHAGIINQRQQLSREG
jgi:hypothetical protein